MNGRHILATSLAGLLALTTGCAGAGRTRSATALATDIPPETAHASYWLDQAPVVSVHSSNYANLIQEAEHVLRQRFFEIDRLDYRTGLLVSKPLVSKQIWEFWRSDVGSTQQAMASSVATHRRIVQWEISQADPGQFTAIPHVVVELISSTPHRITLVTGFRGSINTTETQTGLPTSRLEQVSPDQWYAIGRDKALELALADDLLDRMQKHPGGATLQRSQPTDGK